MLYTNPNIRSLPTLNQTVEILKDLVRKFPVVHRNPFSPILDDPTVDVLTRTDRMYSIKPNISTQGCLYGWLADFNPLQTEYFPSLYNDSVPDFRLNNILREEAEIVFESHPLYSLLKQGIIVSGVRRPIQIFNPYGLAHSYGFKSPFISLTSNIEIAAFHACHKFEPTTQEFIPCLDENKSGLLFIFELGAPFSLFPNLSTVGRQPFKRPGKNRLFVFGGNKKINFFSLPFVKGFQFRHTETSTIFFGNKFSDGTEINPLEIITNKIKRILSERKYSMSAIQRNLSYNPQDTAQKNIKLLFEKGFELDNSRRLQFTQSELNIDWFSDVRTNWSDFWKDVAFPGLNYSQIKAILDLPNNPTYAKFFNEDLWFHSHAR